MKSIVNFKLLLIVGLSFLRSCFSRVEDCPNVILESPFKDLLIREIQLNPYSGYLTLATIEKNRPRARTVLFQGIVEKPDGSIGICIKAHVNSSKITQSDSPAVEIVWWMEKTGVQFRFSGNISYDDELERHRIWRELNPAAKSQFFYNAAAGLDVSPKGPLFKEEIQRVKEKGLSDPPETFVVGILLPSEVDFLDLNTLKRHRWTRNETSTKEEYFWIEKKGYAPPVVSIV